MRSSPRRTKTIALSLAGSLAALGLAACGGDDAGGGGDGGPVTIWMSLDQSVVDGLTQQMEAKAQEAGIEVSIERVDSIDKVIKTRIEAGDPPDIALLPQPGVVGSIVELGAAFPLDDVLDMSALEESMVPGTLEAGTFEDQLYGLLISMNVKSLLFYPKKAFEQAGYEVPTTLDELTALADQIKQDGGTPWCLTMESGDATGWVATDWFEELVLRVAGQEGYEQWVTHETPFDSPEVRDAAAYFEQVAFPEGNVLGGRQAIAATPFAEAARPMFAQGGPNCWLLKQGSFFVAPDFLPEQIWANVDEELGVATFPGGDAAGTEYVLGGGDLAMLFSDSEDAKTAMNLLSEADVASEVVKGSSFISPHKDFDASLYQNETLRTIAEQAYGSTAFLYDGSDRMPAEVGAGSFWKQMTAWIIGDQSLDDTLKNIDDSWPQS